ncbi:MAG: endo-1,4-beta-xylanase, partial [Mucilaginibacter sp.]
MNYKLLQNQVKWIAAAVITASVVVSCSVKHNAQTNASQEKIDTNKGLKDYFKDYFPIGVAVSTASLHGADSALIVREFNSFTPENDMKMGPIHPNDSTYNWKNSDAIVNFAEAHHIRIRGHNLCWHAQEARWMFTGPDGKPVTKELLLKRLHDHIFAVAGHYKGKIYTWDVVNEAIDDSKDTTQIYRKSNWYTTFGGPEFIAAAFRFAHEADPNAKLFYNDYNSEQPIKREKILKLLKYLKANHVPIDGVGFQAHWKLYEPSADELRTALDEVIALGLKVQFTELDITVRLPRPTPAPG